MRVGIDASNLRSGGGLTHLVALLEHADAQASGLERVIVWGPAATLSRLPERPWLSKRPSEITGPGYALRRPDSRAFDVLFAPGGLCKHNFHPIVTMSRNMLPFQWREAVRYGPSKMLARLVLLHVFQKRSFRTADGVIFLSSFAERTVRRSTGPLRGMSAVIPHGVAEAFFQTPRPGRPLAECSRDRPLRILYTSIVDVYKHQWLVAEAAARLREEGLPIAVDFVGNSYPKAGKRLQSTLRKLDPQGTFLTWHGPLEHANLPARYHAADAFVFASSCENLPNILLEAMAAGLPIACSSRDPMPEILGPAGLYFDPLNPHELADALRQLVLDAPLRGGLAADAYHRARRFSWTRCAQDTFQFLADVWETHRATNLKPRRLSRKALPRVGPARSRVQADA